MKVSKLLHKEFILIQMKINLFLTTSKEPLSVRPNKSYVIRSDHTLSSGQR